MEASFSPQAFPLPPSPFFATSSSASHLLSFFTVFLNENTAVFSPNQGDFVLLKNGAPSALLTSVGQSIPDRLRCSLSSPLDQVATWSVVYTPSTSSILDSLGFPLRPFSLLIVVS